MLFVKFMEIKIASEIKSEIVAWNWIKFMRPMAFDNAIVLFGSKNPFHKKISRVSLVKCTVNLTASCEMIEAIKGFIRTGDFQWEKVSENFVINFQLSCPQNRVGK